MNKTRADFRSGLILGILGTLFLCGDRLGLSAAVQITLDLILVAFSFLEMHRLRAARARGELPTYNPAQLRRTFWKGTGICVLMAGFMPSLMPWLHPAGPEESLGYRIAVSVLACGACVGCLWYGLNRQARGASSA